MTITEILQPLKICAANLELLENYCCFNPPTNISDDAVSPDDVSEILKDINLVVLIFEDITTYLQEKLNITK
ncbi:hypothetical protein H6G41_32465 [Tolypothrix sp. FACHB-123]|uniref:hypothetical protein n=1 Tax=Tolypothrix sp. FACHB-123 TaxID=2692868 RepID=UPI001688F4B2|nr:hypothetical protein [Tolypothrix sp. FACHB-123]MBD2359246.1 hypothetical protein [Tolypothrix sp. FACHB-123]